MEKVKTSIRKYWNWRSQSYGYDADKSRNIEKRWESVLNELVSDTPGKQALDIGTGRGQFAFYLDRLGFNVTGIDLSEKMVSHARQYASINKLNIVFQTGDAEHLAFKDNTFDVVVSRNLLWTLPHPDKALKEWRRVLRPYGTLVISDGFWMNYTWKRVHHLAFKLFKEKFQNGSLTSLRFFRSYALLQKALPCYEGICFDKAKTLLQSACFKEVAAYDVSCFGMNPYAGGKKSPPPFFIAYAKV
ncbi:MAG: class I SAM-dependent methyltransferase [Thermodesulfobacteriota bacterium]|nr:class I SAM-dependent methyltransferase [Thermodesulfobacteriota bacterium]